MARPLFRRIRRVVAITAAALLFVVLAGATYQGVVTALERRRFPHPGRLVDVGGHQLHIYCTGEGAPTVVLEAGAAGMSAQWGWVQPPVAETTRVCSYDRAGLGWSEAGTVAYEPAQVPVQLQALLMGAGERAPFVVVGHGLGAAFARLFAAAFPGETAALVLIDAPPRARVPEGTLLRVAGVAPWLARTGVLRAQPLLERYASGLPDDWTGGAMRAFLNRPDHLTRAAVEIDSWNRAVTLAADAPLPPVPVLELEVTGATRVSLLDDRARATQAIAAITEAIARVRDD